MGTLVNALKALFTKSNITSDSSRAVPILNSAKEVEGSMSIIALSQLLAGWKYRDFVKNSNLPGGTFASMRGANMNGLWGFSTTNLIPSDVPSGFQNGLIFHVDLYADVSLQICIERDLGLKTRIYWYGTWRAWA